VWNTTLSFVQLINPTPFKAIAVTPVIGCANAPNDLQPTTHGVWEMGQLTLLNLHLATIQDKKLPTNQKMEEYENDRLIEDISTLTKVLCTR
jgi:hypothetical protein